jgi:hypothetical protein
MARRRLRGTLPRVGCRYLLDCVRGGEKGVHNNHLNVGCLMCCLITYRDALLGFRCGLKIPDKLPPRHSHTGTPLKNSFRDAEHEYGDLELGSLQWLCCTSLPPPRNLQGLNISKAPHQTVFPEPSQLVDAHVFLLKVFRTSSTNTQWCVCGAECVAKCGSTTVEQKRPWHRVEPV